jgi:HSP20 family protein
MAIRNLIPKKSVLARRDEDNPFAVLRHEMDSLFDNFFRGFELEPFEGRIGTFAPRMDVSESDKEITVTAELAGIDEKDIEVSLSDDMLTIKGEKKEEKEDKGKDYYRMERSYGSFSRTIALPSEVQADKVDATFKKGVLKVTLPKSEKAVKATQKVAIKAG